LLDRYQTGPFVTLLFFVGVLGLFVFGFVNALHFHHKDGWIQVALSPLLLLTFHQRYAREAE
jgi:hypothetical protein